MPTMPQKSSVPSRRSFLQYGALAGGTVLAGCLGTGDSGGETDNGSDGSGPPSFPEIEDPPSVVYKPTHYEGMEMLDTVSVDGVNFRPMVTYPHQFWTITGEQTQAVEPTESDDIHLMVTAWDEETGMVIPADSGVTFDIFQDGERVTTNNPWLMLSQEMGFHFGDNIPLNGNGTYRVEGEIGPLNVRRTGAFADRFDDTLSYEFEFGLDDELRQQMNDGVEYIDEGEWGEPGALEPMVQRMSGGMAGDMPYSSVPPATELPGQLQGRPASDDAVLATTLLGPETGLGDGSMYLAVSPRSPYNRSVLPLMSLDATLERDGEQLDQTTLRETFDDTLNYHYGASFDDIQSGDALTIDIIAPPQAARHQGYETAFVEMQSVTVELDP